MASIRERPLSGGESTWAVLYRLPTGKQTSSTFESQQAAEKFKQLLDLLGVDRALKAAGGGQEKGISVAELWRRFIEWKGRPEDKGGLTPRVLKDYQRDYANWIDPWFGHREADLVDDTEVQDWVDHMTAQLAPKTVADRHALLHGAYAYGIAKTRRLVTTNPCTETTLPERAKKPPKGTTVPEFTAIRSAAAGAKDNPDAADLILFLGETGWRFSEATALTVGSVEDDGIDVWVTVSQVTRRDERGRQYLAEDKAKSYAAFRRIRMFPETAAMIRRRVVGRGLGELVFTNSRGNQWSQDTWLNKTWPGIVKAAGLADARRPTPHWLRHMHVAVLIAAGASLAEVQRRIGHESIQTTINVYGGMIGDIGNDALERAAALMSGRRSAPGIAPVVSGEVVELLELD